MQSNMEPLASPQLQQVHPARSQQDSDTDRYHAGQHLHLSSMSSIAPDDPDQWHVDLKPWDAQAAHFPSLEKQHAALAYQDSHSMSNTDLSSNTAGESTPESQQTSNTSYRENEHQTDQSTREQEGDDSFYWHSARSSSEPEEGRSQSSSPVETPGQASVGQRSSATNSTVVPREHPDLPIRSTSLSPSFSAPYGASALGFGGPSDWEYFGDYEADEVDDEDLYSRPKHRGSNGATEASAELPADLPFADSMQDPSRSELPTSRSMPETTASLPEGSLAMHQVACGSPKHPSQRPEASAGGDTAKVANTASEQSPFRSCPLSDTCVAPSNRSPEQRPDLDEVIRAWSEAPFVGAHVQNTQDDYEEPPDVAEASLASTPREKMFGVDVILRDAPSLPKLPASMDLTKPPEDQAHVQHDRKSLTISSMISSTSKGSGEQELNRSSIEVLTSAETVVYEDRISTLGREGRESTTQDLRPLFHDSLIPPTLNDTQLTEPIIASDPSLGHSSGTELTNESTESSASIPYKLPHLQSSIMLRPVSPPSAALEDTQEVVRDSAVKDPDGSRRSTIASPAPEGIDNLGKSDSGHETFESHAVESPISRKSLALGQESTQVARPGSYQVLTPIGLAETSVKTSPKKLIEDSETAKYAESSQNRLSESSNLSQPSENVKVQSNAAEVNGPTVTIGQHRENVGAFEECQQSQAPTTPVVGPPQQNEVLFNNSRFNDLYADLDPWGKASLNRFAAMLREEARAESNKDKLNIFNVFTSRESRLRVVLYGTDDELIIPPKPSEQGRDVVRGQETTPEPGTEEKPQDGKLPEKSGFVKQAVQRANTIILQRSLKALPALPSNRDSVIGLSGNSLAPLVLQDSVELPKDHENPAVESPSDEAQYSPGGRPVVTQLHRENNRNALDVSQDVVASTDTVAGANDIHSPNSNAPITLGSEDGETKKLAHTPLKYNEPRSEVRNYLANRKSVIRPYATLTQGSLESRSIFGGEEGFQRIPKTSDQISAPTSQYNTNTKPKGDDPSEATLKAKTPVTESQQDLRRFVKADFDPLLTVLPESDVLVSGLNRLEDLRHVMEAVPDDFSFIHQSVVAWDITAKKQREENDRQRHVRQMESEQRIDSLFDDHEIGYGDISELESEFKRSEAARKADEDRSEYQMFVSDVFNVVWTRLHYELDQLIPHYEQYSKLMNDTLAGKEMFEGSSDSLALAPTMSSFLGLHQKLEIRHQKAFEAVLERDRRLKKTEISPWYTLSNIAKVKQLEKQFEDAEKKAIIEYCQQRDTRANRLMDVLDQNTLRGVGANQDYMEAIMKAVRRIASGRAFSSVAGSNEPAPGMEEVEKARTIATLLATSSEQIVQTFHVADMLLNSADYEVSVAKAKVAKADMATLSNLKEERAKEDQKLMRDLEHRLALIREDTRRTNDEIVKFMLILGVQNGRADSSTPAAQAVPSDLAHEARIQKALEEAKRRNALKESNA